VPCNGFIRDVCRRHGGAVALTSANVSGAESPLEPAEFRELWGAEGLTVFDGGRIAAAGAGSTILDLSTPGRFAILRRGDAGRAESYCSELAGKFGLERMK
jgi:tRNA A37 threonylcarbamoyladenosine synthetase subunit TsaC/SUA5/YrdC